MIQNQLVPNDFIMAFGKRSGKIEEDLEQSLDRFLDDDCEGQIINLSYANLCIAQSACRNLGAGESRDALLASAVAHASVKAAVKLDSLTPKVRVLLDGKANFS